MRPVIDHVRALGGLMHQPIDQDDIETKSACPRCAAYGFSRECTVEGEFVQLHMVSPAVRARWEEMRKRPSGGYSMVTPPQDDTSKGKP